MILYKTIRRIAKPPRNYLFPNVNTSVYNDIESNSCRYYPVLYMSKHPRVLSSYIYRNNRKNNSIYNIANGYYCTINTVARIQWRNKLNK